jgi:hypothetical protein
MVRLLLEHVTGVLGTESTAGTREVIHRDAQMRLLVSFRKLLRGRAAVLDAIEQGRAAVVFRAHIQRFEWLDEITALSFGHARYLLEDGEVCEGDVCWLVEFRDGLIWRVHAFDSEAGLVALTNAEDENENWPRRGVSPLSRWSAAPVTW